MRKVGLSRFADVSMYTRAVTTLFAALLALSVVSCGIGLEPARSEGAVVSLSVTTIPGYESGRAVAPVSSFLYIRMLGGPDGTGAKGYYGPYSLSIQTLGGALFTTKEIPAGDYSGMAVLMSESKIDTKSVMVGGKPMTMAQVFALPDGEFHAAVTTKDLTSGFTLLDTALNNLGSCGITDALTIRANQVNPVSVTLRPATTVSTSATERVSLYNEEDPFRSFARLAGLRAIDPSAILEGQTAMVKVTVNNTGFAPINLRALAFYSEAGALIPGSTLVSKSVATNSPPSVTFPWDGKDSCFFYAETEGTGLSLSFDITFTKTPPTGGFPVTVTNIPEKYEGWEVSVIVSPMQLTETQYQEGATPEMMMQMGFAKGNVSGTSFTSTCFGYLTFDSWNPVEGTTYYVYVILDSETKSAILMASGTQTGEFKPLYSSELNPAGVTINAVNAVIIDGSTPTPVFAPIKVTISNLNNNMGTVELLVYNVALSEANLASAFPVYSYTLPSLNSVEVVQFLNSDDTPWQPAGSATPYYIYLRRNNDIWFSSDSTNQFPLPIYGSALSSGQSITIDAQALKSFTNIYYALVTGMFDLSANHEPDFSDNGTLRVVVTKSGLVDTWKKDEVGHSISINRSGKTWTGLIRRDAPQTLYYVILGERYGAPMGIVSGERFLEPINEETSVDINLSDACSPVVFNLEMRGSVIEEQPLYSYVQYLIQDEQFTTTYVSGTSQINQFIDNNSESFSAAMAGLFTEDGVTAWIPIPETTYWVILQVGGETIGQAELGIPTLVNQKFASLLFY